MFAACLCFGRWRVGLQGSLVARFVRDEEVVGSNPASPTSLLVCRGGVRAEPCWAGDWEVVVNQGVNTVSSR